MLDREDLEAATRRLDTIVSALVLELDRQATRMVAALAEHGKALERTGKPAGAEVMGTRVALVSGPGRLVRRLEYTTEKCRGCGACVDVFPVYVYNASTAIGHTCVTP